MILANIRVIINQFYRAKYNKLRQKSKISAIRVSVDA